MCVCVHVCVCGVRNCVPVIVLYTVSYACVSVYRHCLFSVHVTAFVYVTVSLSHCHCVYVSVIMCQCHSVSIYFMIKMCKCLVHCVWVTVCAWVQSRTGN